MSLVTGEGSSYCKRKEVVDDKPPTEVEKGEEGPYFKPDHFVEEEVYCNPNSKFLSLIDSWYDTHSHFLVVAGDY